MNSDFKRIQLRGNKQLASRDNLPAGRDRCWRFKTKGGFENARKRKFQFILKTFEADAHFLVRATSIGEATIKKAGIITSDERASPDF